MIISSAAWTGDGTTGRKINDGNSYMTPKPKVVFGQGVNQPPFIWIEGMTGSVQMSAAITGMNAQGVSASTAGGIGVGLSNFTIGNDNSVNQNGTSYQAWILYLDTDNFLDIGSYVGNATNNTIISTTHNNVWDLILTVPTGNNNDVCVWTTSDIADGSSQNLGGTLVGTLITQRTVSGQFRIGNGNGINRSGETFYYLCMKKVASIFGTLSYSGTGSQHNVGSFGFTASGGYVKGAQAATGNMQYPNETDNHSFNHSAGTETAQGINARGNGTFGVGTASNANNNTIAFVGIALKTTTPPPVAPSGSMLMQW